MSSRRLISWAMAWLLGLAVLAAPAAAAPSLGFSVSGEADGLDAQLRGASLVAAAIDEGQTNSADLVSAALADYRRLTETLYGNGYFSGVVTIRLDGREAAGLSLLSLPAQINRIEIAVDPGRPFRFGAVSVSPLAPGAEPPADLVPGEPARATLLRAATQEVIVGWRDAGHAKAAAGPQRIVADHRAGTLSADIRVIPGPRVTFGDLRLSGTSAVRPERLARIAGLPTGEVFSPDQMSRVATRLRRTGTFSSVNLQEGEVNPDQSMDVDLSVVDRKPRRIGFGAELSSREGLDLSAFWLHRNLFGGAERLRIEFEAGQISAQDDDPDYRLGARLEIPAVFGPDTSLFFFGDLQVLDETRYRADLLELGTGVTWYARDGIEAEAGVTFLRSNISTDFGSGQIKLLTFPASVTWDRRDDPLNATSGTYLRVEATPFAGLSGSKSGARLYADARGYRSFGEGRFTLAGRLQLGSIVGPLLRETYPDFLFYSGGGGTVRGQPYQSLEVDLGGGLGIGGRSFVGTMMELRAGLSNNLGAVLFADAGYIGRESFVDGSGDWHAGAGVGLRYNTGIGPIRFDVAAPVAGDTGAGVQLYIGIGQAF